MKICLIVDTRNIHFKRWVRDLKRLGHELYVFSPWEAQIDSKHVEFIPTPRAPFPMFKSFKTLLKMLYRIKLAYDIKKKLKTIKPDIVHAHFLTDCGWIGAWLNFHPFIVTVHGSDILIHPFNSRIYRFAVSFILKRADKVIIVANHFKKNLNKFGCRDDKIVFIPNYVDPGFFISDADLSSKFEDIQRSPRIISARKLAPVYNVETLIRAAPQIVKIYPRADFRILDEGEEYQKLAALTQELNLTKNIKFIGRVNHHELAEYFKESHIYISTALSDGLSVTTLESIASGMFPIVTDIPANRILIKTNSNGYLFPSKDHFQLSEYILDAIKKSKFVKEVCSKNLTFIRDNYSNKQIFNTLEKTYRNLVKTFS